MAPINFVDTKKILTWKFINSSKLVNQKENHSFNCDLKLNQAEEKPFKCDQCEYMCNRKDNLKAHQRKHTNEKAFECDQCKFKFTTTTHLKRHMLIHSQVKPFVCDKCDFKCARADNLKTHQRTHTDMNPWNFFFKGQFKVFNFFRVCQNHARKIQIKNYLNKNYDPEKKAYYENKILKLLKNWRHF